MSKNYIDTPESISISSIIEKKYTLSSSQYKQLVINNKNCKLVKDFLSRELKRSDLGNEIGSINYIGKSSYYFIRTKALQSYAYLPEITKETAIPIMPSSFKTSHLKKGDIIISKDSNIGEIIILDKDYPNHMLSGALYKLPVKENKYYLLAMIKHNIFRQQLDFIVPKGATIRHAKTMFLDCQIPIPNKQTKMVIEYVELLMKAIINKESMIKEKHLLILKYIEDELSGNQKESFFTYEFPRITLIEEIGRLDTNLYTEKFCRNIFKIKNYVNGYTNIKELGFELSRGQNLQVSNIGKSIYSTKKHSGFYTLMLPKFLSKYGTVNTIEYLGNSRALKTLKKGDVIFGAEGFEKGRSIAIIEEKERTITNIHGITIQQKKSNVIKGIFVKCFLDYLRDNGLIDLYAVGGNGGSLAQKYWSYIPFPKFNDEKQEEISKLYHNPQAIYSITKCSTETFLKVDDEFNKIAGIYELDKAAKTLRKKVDDVIDNIINDIDVSLDFNF